MFSSLENFRQDHFCTASNGVKINLPVHLIAAHDIVFHCMHSSRLNYNLILNRTHHSQNTFHIKMPVAHTGKISIPLKIIHAIGIDLRSEEHTSELQSRFDLVCRLLLEKI